MSVVERKALLKRLLADLLAQVEQHRGRITVLCYIDNFDTPRWKARQQLLETATASYVNFVDDDDRIAADYCDRIIGAMAGAPDYVGFRLQCWWGGKRLKPTFHSIRFPGWSDDDNGYYRDISHLNPIRRALALRVPFPEEKHEDAEWARLMSESGLVRTEAFISDPMYFYRYNPRRSLVAEANRTYKASRVVLPLSPYITYLGPCESAG